ncbi:MAG: hypothetical protein R2824_09135 [Saprospiraceae bacterium]|nr:hypothetical protein [Lewinella sp.]
MKFAQLVLLLLIGNFLLAQGEETVFVDRYAVEGERYPDIKGNPYLFKNGKWFKADLITRELKTIPNILTRYNTYTGDMEVKRENGDTYYKLVPKDFVRIEFSVDENGKTALDPDQRLIFQNGFHPRFNNRFVNLVYTGNSMVVFRDYRCIISDEAARRVGQSIEVKQFRPRVDYYLLKNGELSELNVRKNALIKILGHKKQLDTFFKENKLDLDNTFDLQKVFAYAESLGK